MKNIIRKVALALIASSCVCVAPIMAQDVSSYQLEKALMKYVLTYEAYQKAKQSTNKEVRANLPKYIRLYREAYAQYLELLRQAELYDPKDKDNDPVGNFNRKEQSHGRKKRNFKPVKSGSQREQVKRVVENGGNPDDVYLVVKQNLPSKSYSVEEGASDTADVAGSTDDTESQSLVDQQTGDNSSIVYTDDTTTTDNTGNDTETTSSDGD